MDRTLGGTVYWRQAALSGGVVRTVKSSRTIVPEIGADEARQVNDAIAGFNNNVSTVSERPAKGRDVAAPAAMPFDDAVDWTAETVPACSAPASHK